MSSTPTVLLILDENETDRNALGQALAGSVNEVIVASNFTEASSMLAGRTHLSVMVAAIPENDGGSVFDFRDSLAPQLGSFPSSFCSGSDMTAYYGRVTEKDKLFYKPVEVAALQDWILQSVGPPAPAAPPQEQVAPPPQEQVAPPPQEQVAPPPQEQVAPPPQEQVAPPPQEQVAPPPQEQAAPPPQEQAAPPPQEQGPTSLTSAVYAGAAAPPQTPPAAAAPVEGHLQNVEAYDEDLPVGTRLGDYLLERIIQKDADFALYEAEQTSINRKVAIKTLYRKHRRDPAWVQAFVNEASARARVNHPNISLVYECVQEQGVNFYTLELVDAPSLADLAAQRANLGDDTLWGVLESCSSALEYFRSQQMQHRIITAQTILLQNGDQTRIANPVKSIGGFLSPDEEKQQMQYLGSALKPFIRKGVTDPGLYSIIDRMGQERIDGIRSIGSLRRSLNEDSISKRSGLSDSRVAEITEKETNKKAIVTGGLIGAILLVSGLAASFFLKKDPVIKEFNEFSHIPAGPFPYQDGEMVELPDFWISQQEVTIGQYAEFLNDIKNKPTTLAALQHPDQPEDKTSHEPEKWALMYHAALKGKKFLNGPIDPNCPVSGVDWWDAYTYARWKNARLPTEKEWEKAARGRGGNLYPWGNELDYSKFNSGVDQREKEDQKPGSVDGFQFWAPVDSLTLDMSRYAVNGMAGNVSEWTATWDAHPDSPDKMVPIKRGGSFATTDGFESTSRRAAEMAEERYFYTGFRIVSDVEPGTDPNYKPPPPQRIATQPSSSKGGKGPKGDGKGKGKGKGDAPAPSPAPTNWDPADGKDPFTTIFAVPAK